MLAVLCLKRIRAVSKIKKNPQTLGPYPEGSIFWGQLSHPNTPKEILAGGVGYELLIVGLHSYFQTIGAIKLLVTSNQ